MMRQQLIFILALALLIACETDDTERRIVGQLESDRVELAADVNEPITDRLVVEGQSVVAGTPLVLQNTDRINASIAEATALLGQNQARLAELVRGPRSERIVAAQADVVGAREQLDFRRTQHTRAVDLLNRDLAAPELRDRAKADLDTAVANLDAAEARLEELLTGTTLEELQQAEQSVKQTEAKVESLMISLDRHQTVAPIDGVVDSILFESGERPPVGQPILILLPGTQPYARVYVPESQRAATTPGTEARIYVDGIERAFEGRVRWVASEAAFTPYFALTEHDRGRLTYLAKVDLLDSGDRLPDGVPVEVELGPALP